MKNDNPETDLFDKMAVRRFFGGTKPLSHTSLYRGIADGLIPKPIKRPGGNRWLRSECEAALQASFERRDEDYQRAAARAAKMAAAKKKRTAEELLELKADRERLKADREQRRKERLAEATEVLAAVGMESQQSDESSAVKRALERR